MSAPGSTTVPSPDPATPDNGRDSKGKFTKGNAGGPGNPFARQVAELRSRLMQRMTPEKMDEVADALFEQVTAGDLAAIRLLLLYTLGKPAAPVDPDRLDQDELALFAQQGAGMDLFSRVLGAMPAPLALELLRTMMPGLTLDYRRLFNEGFAARYPEDLQAAQQARAAAAQAPVAEQQEQRAPPRPPSPAPRKQPKKPRPDPAPAPPPPTLEQVLAAAARPVVGLRLLSPDSPSVGQPPVSKRGETGRRAANDGQSPPPPTPSG